MPRFRMFQRLYLTIVVIMIAFSLIGIVMRHSVSLRLPFPQWVFVFIGISMILSLGSYPFVRRLTTRLSRLQQTVSDFGRGELDIRAAIEGNDEVAQLAQGFNQAAERIETLVAAHRRLLANASHELRTPLTRIRMGVELLSASTDSAHRAELTKDLRELDDLLEEILLASRLEALADGGEADQEIDLLALIAEECARYDHVDFEFPSSDDEKHVIWLHGNERLLRRLVRNLLENARRHGAPPTKLCLLAVENGFELCVTDGGTGVAQADRERVFEPFFRGGNAEENVGSGLGLSLVRQIARRHGGEARCVDRGEGVSAFIVRLPRGPQLDA
ncbi:MAG: HAMP domain-containing sensor histidine kinase [Dokdonella sp.]